MDPNQALSNQKYMLLETYKKNGEAKRTVVGFAVENGIVFFYTNPKAWKAKRLRRNSKVRLAGCSWGGEVKGEWADGRAHRVKDSTEAKRIIKLVNSKYGMRARIGVAIQSAIQGDRIVFSIRPEG
jgi:uncharacterized protein